MNHILMPSMPTNSMASGMLSRIRFVFLIVNSPNSILPELKMISLETYNTLQHTGKLTEPHHSLDQDHDGSSERNIGSR